MPKCVRCVAGEAEVAWQPFGPDDSPLNMSFLGAHYRGFPILKLCQNCADEIRSGRDIDFDYKNLLYQITWRGGSPFLTSEGSLV